MIAATVGPELFTQNYADVFKGDSRWNQIASPEGESYAWDDASTYIKNPPYFDGMTMQSARSTTSTARACSACSATRSPPTTSRRPATSRRIRRRGVS